MTQNSLDRENALIVIPICLQKLVPKAITKIMNNEPIKLRDGSKLQHHRVPLLSFSSVSFVYVSSPAINDEYSTLHGDTNNVELSSTILNPNDNRISTMLPEQVLDLPNFIEKLYAEQIQAGNSTTRWLGIIGLEYFCLSKPIVPLKAMHLSSDTEWRSHILKSLDVHKYIQYLAVLSNNKPLMRLHIANVLLDNSFLELHPILRNTLLDLSVSPPKLKI